MLDYKLIEAAAQVVALGSFERAARALHITQSAVSQRIRALEQQLGQPLIVRGPPPQPTECGRALIRHYEQVRALQGEFEQELDMPRRTPHWQKMAVALNNDSLYYWFIDALLPLLKSKRLLLDLLVADEQHTAALLRSGKVAAAISCRAEAPNGCSSELLGGMEYLCVASRRFRSYFEAGVTPAVLQQAPHINFDANDTLHGEYLARHFNLDGAAAPCFNAPSARAFLALTLAGAAYALIPAIEARPYIRSGRLIEVAPGKTVSRSLYWLSWQLKPVLHSEVSAAVVGHARSVLRQG